MENNDILFKNINQFLCPKCNNEEKILFDFVKAYLEHYPDQDYPKGICDKCRGKTIPLYVYLENNNK